MTATLDAPIGESDLHRGSSPRSRDPRTQTGTGGVPAPWPGRGDSRQRAIGHGDTPWWAVRAKRFCAERERERERERRVWGTCPCSYAYAWRFFRMKASVCTCVRASVHTCRRCIFARIGHRWDECDLNRARSSGGGLTPDRRLKWASATLRRDPACEGAVSRLCDGCSLKHCSSHRYADRPLRQAGL